MTWHGAASVDELRRARPWLALHVGGIDLVVAGAGGAWYGVEDRCTHAGCAFSEDAELAGTDIVCNCHGSEFDLRTGAVRRGPAEHPVRTFPVRIVDDRVEVEV